MYTPTSIRQYMDDYSKHCEYYKKFNGTDCNIYNKIDYAICMKFNCDPNCKIKCNNDNQCIDDCCQKYCLDEFVKKFTIKQEWEDEYHKQYKNYPLCDYITPTKDNYPKFMTEYNKCLCDKYTINC